jgi:hypothetical protein
MLKLEDFEEFDQQAFKRLSKENSIVVVKLKNGVISLTTDIEDDDEGIISTESGPVLSQEYIDSIGTEDYLFVPKGSLNDVEI